MADAYTDTLDALRWITLAERLAPACISEAQLKAMPPDQRANAMAANQQARQVLFPSDEEADG